MKKGMDTVLNACLEALENGESVDAILSRYPERMTELRPFLETAVLIQSQAHNPTVAAQAASLAAMKKEADRLRPPVRAGWARFFQRSRRFAPALALFAIVILFALTLSAPPTSPLHGARLFLDGFRNTPTVVAPTLTPVMKETAVLPTKTSPARITSESSRTPPATPAIPPSATVTATRAITPTATPTLTATPTATLTATPSPPPAPTADDSDDGEDDGDGTSVEDDDVDDK